MKISQLQRLFVSDPSFDSLLAGLLQTEQILSDPQGYSCLSERDISLLSTTLDSGSSGRNESILSCARDRSVAW